MDEDGYPTDETLEEIKNWNTSDFHGLAARLTSLWRYENYVKWNPEEQVLDISTGGWSGHEELIGAIPSLWRLNYFYSLRRGGHYVFAKEPSSLLGVLK